jgi:sugar/nucleoside kinase (ribokinase family)
MFELVAIGNPVYDEIITPYVNTEGRILSGCSTNACLVARKLGLKQVGFVGCIGRDSEAHFRETMLRYGIDLSGVKVTSKTGGFRLIYDKDGNRTLDVIDLSDKILPEYVPENYFNSQIILLGPVLGEIDIDFIRFIRSRSKAEIFLDPQGIIREVTPSGRVREVSDVAASMAYTRLVDVVKPNEHEAIAITGVEDPFLSARLIVEWGAKLGIVTLADRGSIIARRKSLLRIPAYKTIAKDPTGAGDTYAGAFITKYIQGASLYQCGLFASAAASIKVENTGPEFPLEINEVERRLRILSGE